MIKNDAQCYANSSVVARLGKRFCFLFLLLSVAGCMGWVPGRKAYWDEQVKELCAKDGGVEVYETVELTQDEFRRLGGSGGVLPIPSRDTAITRNYPYFRRTTSTTIRESNPEVAKVAVELVRVTDNMILGRSVQYLRRGGDPRTGLGHESYFICPETVDLLGRVFVTVVATYDDSVDDMGMRAGFQATLLQNTAGKLTLAIRGTVVPDDLLTDSDIFFGGAAYGQIVAMANWSGHDNAY